VPGSLTMIRHAADVLLDAIDRTAAPVCVGVDPVVDRLPGATAVSSGVSPGVSSALSSAPRAEAAAAIRSFTLDVLDQVAEHVPCVKFQSACFERYGHHGVRVLAEMIAAARSRGLEVILDAKRGDIGISAEHYAVAAFGDDDSEATGARWVTVNAYLGGDGIEPFLRPGRGAFALVRTSNPGGDALQSERLADGRTVSEAVAGMVAEVGRTAVGERGFSALGAVVGATKKADVPRLRAIMPQQIFLVPGFGAQGGGVDDVKPAFDSEGRGAIVTASRSVIYAESTGSADWPQTVGEAAARLADEVGRAAGLR